MNKIVRNTLAVFAGIVVGGTVNMSLIHISGSVIPLPPGVNSNDMESLKAGMHLFEPKNFLFPFLAHALGTLAGAVVAARLAASHQFYLAMGIGALYLAGGIAAVMMLPAPMWFNALDLIVAYLPMGWLGWRLGGPASRKA
jgi:hypothetical protein